MLNFNKLLTLGRILTISDKTSQLIRRRFKCKQFYSALAPCSNPSKSSKKLKISYPIQPPAVSCPKRGFCDSTTKENPTNETKNLIYTYDVYFPLFPLFDEWRCLLKSFWINQVIDRTFKPAQFRDSSVLVIKIVSKLISEKRLSELKGLVTPDCISELEQKIDNWNPNERRLLAVSDSDFMVPHFYAVEEISEDYRKGIQVSMYYHIYKDIEHDTERKFLGKTPYGANYRFIKWIQNDSSTEWVVNGINHFKVRHMFVKGPFKS